MHTTHTHTDTHEYYIKSLCHHSQCNHFQSRQLNCPQQVLASTGADLGKGLGGGTAHLKCAWHKFWLIFMRCQFAAFQAEKILLLEICAYKIITKLLPKVVLKSHSFPLMQSGF